MKKSKAFICSFILNPISFNDLCLSALLKLNDGKNGDK